MFERCPTLFFVSVGGDWKKVDGPFLQSYIWYCNNDVRSIVVDPNEKFSNLVRRICNKFEIDKEEFELKLSYNPSTKESILGSEVLPPIPIKDDEDLDGFFIADK